MQNARLDEAQTGIKMAGRNINNLTYAHGTNFQMFKLDLEKAEEQEIKLSTSVWSLKKTREFQRNI